MKSRTRIVLLAFLVSVISIICYLKIGKIHIISIKGIGEIQARPTPCHDNNEDWQKKENTVRKPDAEYASPTLPKGLSDLGDISGKVDQRKIQERHKKVSVSRKRLPGAIIAGIKKCGTATLGTFLDFHPNIVVAEEEVHYFGSPDHKKGIDWYINRMPVSTPGQLTIERSPGYFGGQAAKEIYYELPVDTKIILVACDPVERAISDYIHTVTTKGVYEDILKSKPKSSQYEKAQIFLENIVKFNNTVNTTFESTILDNNRKLVTSHGTIYRGRYSDYIKHWLEYFGLERMLIVDGSEFKVNPVSAIQQVESFLNLQPYFTDNIFYFNETKGFYCIKTPEFCMNQRKGRTHPDVDPIVVNLLREYYRPYNTEFSKLTNQTFSWMS
ncbi:heparan sulfate glucosamine 3-O-sulfotransferase 1-like [Glandiceps talaboti]